MNPALLAIVVAIGAGAVIAVSTREAAAAAIGVAVALVASALLSDPMPNAAIVGVRIVAALLAAALIRWAAPGSQRQYSGIGGLTSAVAVLPSARSACHIPSSEPIASPSGLTWVSRRIELACAMRAAIAGAASAGFV